MRRTSSLGRRSSTQSTQPLRNTCSINDGSSRDDPRKKKSMLLQPGFSRSKSIELNYNVNKESSSHYNDFGSNKKAPPSSLKRSHSQSNMNVLMTPVNSGYVLNENLPTGVIRPDRRHTESARMSSLGGTKSIRKDPRPLADKGYTSSATSKIISFFAGMPDSHKLFDGKILISQLTQQKFADLVSYLLNSLGYRYQITKVNYRDELPAIMKKLGYRGKVEKSWLLTVNAPHSFQHVVGLLEWLVTLVQYDIEVDVEDLMYPSDELNESSFEDDELDFKLVTPYLASSYEHRQEDASLKRDELFLKDLWAKYEIGDIDDLENMYEELKSEVSLESNMINAEFQKIQDLKEKINILKLDKNANIEFIQKTKLHIEKINQTFEVLLDREKVLQKNVERKRNEKEMYRSQLMDQKEQMIDIKQFEEDKLSLQRAIYQVQEEIKQIENSLFSEDLLVASNRKKVDNAILEYNKIITENRVHEPRLKNMELSSYNILSKESEGVKQNIETILETFSLEYKSEIENLEINEEDVKKKIDKITEELAEIEDENERVKKEKNNEENYLIEKKKYIQTKRKELKDEIANLQSKLQLMKKELDDMTLIGDQEELERINSEIKKMEQQLLIAEEIGKKELQKVIIVAEKTRNTISEHENKLLDKLNTIDAL